MFPGATWSHPRTHRPRHRPKKFWRPRDGRPSIPAREFRLAGPTQLRRTRIGCPGVVDHPVVDFIIPFDPEMRRRDAQQIQASRQALAVGKRQFGACASQVIVEHIAQRAIGDARCVTAGSGDLERRSLDCGREPAPRARDSGQLYRVGASRLISLWGQTNFDVSMRPPQSFHVLTPASNSSRQSTVSSRGISAGGVRQGRSWFYVDPSAGK